MHFHSRNINRLDMVAVMAATQEAEIGGPWSEVTLGKVRETLSLNQAEYSGQFL
jgi:hypothetical protein